MIDIPRPATCASVPLGRVVVGAYLRALRESRGLYLKDAAYRLDYATSSVSLMERAEIPLRPVVVERLLQEYGVREPQEIRAVTMLLKPDGQHLDLHSARARDRLASCWRAAGKVRMYAQRWLPPAVHTTAYARAYAHVHSMDVRGHSSGIRFPEPGAHSSLTLLIDDDILCRPVGGEHAMAEQIGRLQHLVEEGWLVVRVVPLDTPIPYIPTPVTQLDPYGYRLDVETSGAGMRYSTGRGFGAALDGVEEAAYALAVGYDRLEAARAMFAGGRS
ncbi:Scr1 family TA system antitoxin-like transcriptional regulator [Streptomyces niveus]|uniref:Scr1 family TA system antitoxin-like transcriptional regulator n=1 Tax=Streptomyces niveus TaxID=193462 RepID=UPI0036BE31B1